jgi:hypothetical protein
MWLLDVNLPTALIALLQGYGVAAETTAAGGWRELTNGAPAQVAAREGFRTLLTRDRRSPWRSEELSARSGAQAERRGRMSRAKAS